jgi:hypothetical protein
MNALQPVAAVASLSALLQRLTVGRMGHTQDG